MTTDNSKEQGLCGSCLYFKTCTRAEKQRQVRPGEYITKCSDYVKKEEPVEEIEWEDEEPVEEEVETPKTEVKPVETKQEVSNKSMEKVETPKTAEDLKKKEEFEKFKRYKSEPRMEVERKKEEQETQKLRETPVEEKEQPKPVETKKQVPFDLSKKHEEWEKTAPEHKYIDKRYCDKYIQHLKKMNHRRLEDVSKRINKEFKNLIQEVTDTYNQDVDVVHSNLSLEGKLNKACEIVIQKYKPNKQSFTPKPKGEFTRKLTDKFIENSIVKGMHILGHKGKNKDIRVSARWCGCRLVLNAEPESTNTALQGFPGCGKDSLVKRLKMLLFPSKWLHYDCISETFFDHKMAELNEKKLKEMYDIIVYYEDLDGDTLNSKHFRTMLSSKKRHVGWTNKDLGTTESEYPKLPIIMTLGPEIDMNNHIIRRVPGFWMENTPELRKGVAEKAFDDFEKIPYNLDGLKDEDKEFILELIERTENLKPVLVRLLDELKKYCKEKLLPDEFESDIIMTDSKRLADYIKFSAALNQENRKIILENQTINIEETDVTYNVIEATMKDVEKGHEMFESYMEVEKHKHEKTTKWTRIDKKKKYIYEILQKANGNELTYTQIMNKLKDKYQVSISVPTLYNKLDQLVEEKKIFETSIVNDKNQDVRVWFCKAETAPVTTKIKTSVK